MDTTNNSEQQTSDIIKILREKSAQHIAEIIVIVAALAILLSFFFPWMTVEMVDDFTITGRMEFEYTYKYEDYTGIQIAKDLAQKDYMLFGLIVTAVLAIAVTYGYYRHWLERREAGVGYVALGMIAAFILLLEFLGLSHLDPLFPGEDVSGKTYELSFYVAVIASLTIAITGYVVNKVDRWQLAVASGLLVKRKFAWTLPLYRVIWIAQAVLMWRWVAQDQVSFRAAVFATLTPLIVDILASRRIARIKRGGRRVEEPAGVLFPKVGRRQFGLRMSWISLIVFLWVGVVIHLFPFYYMMALSVTPAEETLSPTPVLVPEEPTMTAWKLIYNTATDTQQGKLETSFLRRPFAIYFRNSLFMTLTTMGLSLPITAMAAYANSKLMRGRIKRLSFFFFIGTLMIPGVVTIIPSFLLARHFPFPTTEVPHMPGTDQEFPHLVLWNTPWAVIIPGVFNAFNFLLFKGFFDTIPNSIIQAARVDGGSEFNIFRRIILPMSVPVFAVTAWIQFGAVWEQYLWPLVVIQDGDKQPVTVAVAELVEAFTQSDVTSAEQATANDPVRQEMMEAGLSWNGLMVLGILQAFPVFLMFILCREYLMKGIRVRGFK